MHGNDGISRFNVLVDLCPLHNERLHIETSLKIRIEESCLAVDRENSFWAVSILDTVLTETICR
jgi:hypothetical protein